MASGIQQYKHFNVHNEGSFIWTRPQNYELWRVDLYLLHGFCINQIVDWIHIFQIPQEELATKSESQSQTPDFTIKKVF